MFIEIHAAYTPDEQDVDYDGLGIDKPYDWEPEWSPTLLPVDDILWVNPSSDGFTTIRLKSNFEGLMAQESYEEIKDKIEAVTKDKIYIPTPE